MGLGLRLCLTIQLAACAITLPIKKLPEECANDLYRLRVCTGKSTCSAEEYSSQDQKNGEQAAWDGAGWCAPSHYLLKIDLGSKKKFFQISVQPVASRLAPEYVRLDYWNEATSHYDRYLMADGSDLIPAHSTGFLLDPPIETQTFKLRLVLPNDKTSDKHACMRFELYSCEIGNRELTSRAPSPISRDSPKNVPLEFAIVDPDHKNSYWSLLRFTFYRKIPNLETVYLTLMKIEFEWRVVPIITDSNTPNTTNIKIIARTNVPYNSDFNEDYALNSYRYSKFEFQQSNSQFAELLFLVGTNFQIRIKNVKFFMMEHSSPLVFDLSSPDENSLHTVFLQTHHQDTPSKMLVVAPIADRNWFTHLKFRGNVDWTDNELHSFNAEIAVGEQEIANRQFDRTITFQRLMTPKRKDSYWTVKFDKKQLEPLAFTFSSKLKSFSISKILAYDGEAAITEPTTVEPSTRTSTISYSNQTAAGVVVGIIGALVVVSLVAAILIWRRKQGGGNAQYTTNDLRGREDQASPLYPERQFSPQQIDLIARRPKHISLPNQLGREYGYLLPHDRQKDNIPANDPRSRTVGPLFKVHHSRNPSEIIRPPNAPPVPPTEHIYEIPHDFRTGRKIYGPCGTIRFARHELSAPDGLRRDDPPVISTDLVKVTKELGSGEFGEVFLVEAPIAAFPLMDRSDLPPGATKIFAALKRLKSGQTEETKKTFLAEAKLMYALRHRNILPLLAIIPELPALLSGYSELGDLRQYLQGHLICTQTDRNDPGFISYNSLLDICIQIASAMEYLESQRVVHRDLAARNCFVGRGLTVRVGDFGMSRNLYSKDYFKVTGNAVLPIRWSAWESIILGKFTTQSDIWSYGVTCYEVYMLCRERPHEQSSDEQVIQRMVALYNSAKNLSSIPWLPKPEFCPDEIWEIISNCWQREANQRPPFKTIHHAMSEEQRLLNQADN